MTGLSEFNAWLKNDGSENRTAISGHAKGKFDKWKEVVEKVSELLQQETDEAKELRAYVNNDANYTTWKKDMEAILDRFDKQEAK